MITCRVQQQSLYNNIVDIISNKTVGMALSGRQSFIKMQTGSENESSSPRQGAAGYQPPTDWHSGLCDCLNDAGICTHSLLPFHVPNSSIPYCPGVWGFCCLPCQFGENTGLFYAKSKDNGGECLLTCCLYTACFPFNCCKRQRPHHLVPIVPQVLADSSDAT